MDLLVLAWHFGAAHAYEKVLALALAFGPLLVLAAVIVVRRRADADADDDGTADDRPADPAGSRPDRTA